MNLRWTVGLSLTLFLIITCGCAYRHYLGLHGLSIRLSPGVHVGVTEDRECLACHDPARDPTAPPTSHPGFTGCLKCHNDELRAKGKLPTESMS